MDGWMDGCPSVDSFPCALRDLDLGWFREARWQHPTFLMILPLKKSGCMAEERHDVLFQFQLVKMSVLDGTLPTQISPKTMIAILEFMTQLSTHRF